MRTTLTLDDDVAVRLERLARARRATFKETVNSILRSGLSRLAPSRGSLPKYRVRVFKSPFRPGVDLMRLNALNDELALDTAGTRGR